MIWMGIEGGRFLFPDFFVPCEYRLRELPKRHNGLTPRYPSTECHSSLVAIRATSAKVRQICLAKDVYHPNRPSILKLLQALISSAK
jgi:hypothetical protein